MAVQLILKNSAVQDKEATAAQLAAGEIALNYHSSGPFLQCEDTAGNVWRLGGVVIASTAPTSPSKGAWWLDSDDNHLYFYNGSSWIEIQTGEIVPGDIAEGTARQLLQTNAAGNGTEWTSNIDVPGTLDVTGVATFDNNVVITGNLTVNGTTTTIDTTTLVVEDKNIEMGAVGTPTDSTADGGGITLKGATDKTINWVNATDAWTSSERFDFPAGTAAAPSVILNGDVNSGIYQPGADQVAISTGGSGRLFVDASGRVGVGTTSPAKTFEVNGTAALKGGSPYLYLTQTSATGQSRIYFGDPDTELRGYTTYDHSDDSYRVATASNERLRIDSSGRLLLGVSNNTSGARLQVEGLTAGDGVSIRRNQAGSAAATLTVSKSRGTANGSFTSVANGDTLGTVSFRGADGTGDIQAAAIFASVDGTPGTNDMPGRLVFSTTADGASTATERMRIDSSGRVGVGTTSPGNKLAVSNGTNITEFSGYSVYFKSDTTGYLQAGPSGGSGGRLVFQTNAVERVRIDSSGRVGIGTSSPSAMLHINGGAASTSPNLRISADRGLIARLGDTSGSAQSLFDLYDTDGSTQIVKFISGGGANFINTGGNVGIGTTSPSYKLSLQDAGNNFVQFTSGSDAVAGALIGRGGDTTFRIQNSENAPINFWTNNTERARIDSSGRLLVGTSSGRSIDGINAALQVEGTTTATSAINLTRNANSQSSAFLQFAKSRGTSNGSSTVVQSGDVLGYIQFAGADGTDVETIAANIRAEVDGTPGANDMPGRLVFSTTADGASSPTERVRIEATGKTKFSGATYGVENTITASAFNLNNGNLWTCGAIAIPNPTNAVAGLMGSIRVTAAPTSFGSNFDHPGGSYTAPTSFPAVAPFYCVSSTNILLGSWTQGIA